MTLPELPKQNKKKEADFGIELRKWLKENPFLSSCTFEIKHTRGRESLPFSEIKNEQIAYANKVRSSEGVLIRVHGTNGEPDYNYYRRSPAYIVVRYPKKFYIIPIENLLHEKETSGAKSLTQDRANEIALHIHKIQYKI